MFILKLEIVPIPIRIWDLKPGDRFALEPTGWNFKNERFEIYMKLTRTKALLDSLPEKPICRIPQISKRDVGYKVIENWSRA